jgi:hypothetical protein
LESIAICYGEDSLDTIEIYIQLGIGYSKIEKFDKAIEYKKLGVKFHKVNNSNDDVIVLYD